MNAYTWLLRSDTLYAPWVAIVVAGRYMVELKTPSLEPEEHPTFIRSTWNHGGASASCTTEEVAVQHGGRITDMYATDGYEPVLPDPLAFIMPRPSLTTWAEDVTAGWVKFAATGVFG